MPMIHRRPLAAVLAASAVLAAATGCGESDEAAAIKDGPVVGAFPAPNTQSASMRSEITFRGVGAEEIGEVEVEGSKTGPHPGKLVPHQDGKGASFVPDEPFRLAEQVTVRTALNIPNAQQGDYTFRTVNRPKEGLGSAKSPPKDLLKQYLAQNGKPPKGTAPRYRSRPDLRPPEIELFKRGGKGLAPGYVFLAPKKVFGAKLRPGLQEGAMIIDNRGEPVWFAPAQHPADLRVQQYQGNPVLSFWAGRAVLGTGEGAWTLLDERYKQIAQVKAGNGYNWDFHEGLITDRGTMLSLIYNPVIQDLTSVGGAKSGRVLDGVVQEVEIATGRVVFEWHSLGNVKLKDAHQRSPASRAAPFDFFHVNSVTEDTDGNLLISGRDCWCTVKVDRLTGRKIWTLGGRSSDFKLPKNAVVGWQHDVQRDPDGTIRIFDNAAAPKTRPQSRVVWLRLDEKKMTAKVVRQIEHPQKLSAGTQGNAQHLPNGNVFVGWGSQGYFSEYSKSGKLLFDGRVERGNDSYRAYRFEWEGMPDAKPAVAAEGGAAYVSWNGATKVARYELLGGASADALQPVRTVARGGFETRIPAGGAAYVRVRALDAEGNELGVSDVKRMR